VKRSQKPVEICDRFAINGGHNIKLPVVALPLSQANIRDHFVVLSLTKNSPQTVHKKQFQPPILNSPS